MILLDPDLDPESPRGRRPVRGGPNPAPKPASTTRSSASVSKPKSKANPSDIELPSARTLSSFLAAAQTAVRLKGQVTVLLTTDAAIRKLNRLFRGKNKATDVLSFPAEGPGTEGMAGDLAISVTTAMGQAAEQGHSLSTEIKVLVLHGLLHLAGYDHEADNGKMARRERKLRAQLKLPQGLIERATAPASPSLKGLGFSRAAKAAPKASALAAEGMHRAKKSLPRGLKPNSSVSTTAARLKPSPFKTALKAIPATKAKRP